MEESRIELKEELDGIIGESIWAYVKLILIWIAYLVIITIISSKWDSIWGFVTKPFKKKDSKKDDPLDKEFDV